MRCHNTDSMYRTMIEALQFNLQVDNASSTDFFKLICLKIFHTFLHMNSFDTVPITFFLQKWTIIFFNSEFTSRSSTDGIKRTLIITPTINSSYLIEKLARKGGGEA